jgi:hypothetical protein
MKQDIDGGRWDAYVTYVVIMQNIRIRFTAKIRQKIETVNAKRRWEKESVRENICNSALVTNYD